MKASKNITISALAALSLALVPACASEEEAVTADCAVKQSDGSYKAVDDDMCDKDGHSGSGGFIWIYGGTYSGGHVQGGTMQRPSNTNINTRSGRTVVGGFGSSSKGGSGS